jgi:hypothetical protein
MEKNDTKTVDHNDVDSQNGVNDSNDLLIDVSETPIIEYLEIVKDEYEIERNKKQSFENRAGLILALVGAICIFVFEKVKLNDVISLMSKNLTFFIFLKIVSGVSVYVGFAITMIMILRTITVQKQDNFEVKSIDESLITENRTIALCRVIFTYRDIIIQHRTLNEKRAKSFRWCLYGLSLTLVSTIIYLFVI